MPLHIRDSHLFMAQTKERLRMKEKLLRNIRLLETMIHFFKDDVLKNRKNTRNNMRHFTEHILKCIEEIKINAQSL